MTQAAVSVVVVSRKRPAALIRCLTSISQQRHARFEVVVVADTAGLDAVRRWPPGRDIKTVLCDEANISRARNLGTAAAAGDIIAFIDDDAAAEPQWLVHLAAAFDDPSVSAAGGYVRGRNGISWQWRAQSVDLAGYTRPLQIRGDDAVVLTPSPGRAIRVEGTNMAFRREVLARLGGFDPNFHYFLEETDLTLRLALVGGATAVVPRAVVHHSFAESDVRRSDRVPRDLTEIGASWAVFLSKHCPEQHRDARWKDVQRTERRRLVGHMVAGRLEPRDVRRLMRSLNAGFTEGKSRHTEGPASLATRDDQFRRFPSVPDRTTVCLSGRIWARERLRHEAEDAARAGHIASLFLFSPTALFHRVRYDGAGYWEQSGGLFGKSVRSDPLVRIWRFRNRVERERRLWSFCR